MITGISGVWLSVKENILAWPFFLICYGCYVYIGYDFGLPALTGMNLVFMGLALYGWFKWSKQVGDGAVLKVSRTGRAHWPLVVSFIGVATYGLGWILTHHGGATHAYIDAFATCCGFTAQWMLGRKHIETWIFWIISDTIYLGLFLMGSSWPTVVLFAVFIILALKGWREWRRELSPGKNL